MSNEKLSVIIPACNEKYLQKTIENLLENAEGDIEIIAYLDGYWPVPPIENNDHVTIIHVTEREGMRNAINACANIATGKYLMKCDAHCAFDKGFDKKMKEDCEPGWLSIPARYSLDEKTWSKTRGPFHYLFLTFPFGNDKVYGRGFHGKKLRGTDGVNGGFFEMEKLKRDILIDDIQTFQGSCWFMHRQTFFDIDCMDEENYAFHQEAQELGFKIWMSGGRVIRNKKTWYAHFHKNKDNGGRGYFLSKKSMVRSEVFSADFWMNDRWEKRIPERSMKWFVDKFGPIASWPEDWQDKKYQEMFENEVKKR